MVLRPYAIIIGAGLVLSTYRAASLAPWADELGTLYACSQPFQRTWPLIVSNGGYFGESLCYVSVGHYLLIKALFGLFGAHLILPRLASAVGHVVTACLVYRIFDRAGLRRPGGMVAALVLIHPALLWHACDARWYSLLLASHALSLWLLLSPDFPRRVCLWILVTALGAYLHHYSLVLIGCEIVFVLVHYPSVRKYMPVLLLLLSPELVLLHRACTSAVAASTPRWVGDVPFLSLVTQTCQRLGGSFPVDLTLPIPWHATLVVGVALLIFCSAVTLVHRTRTLLWLAGATWVYVVLSPLGHWWCSVVYDPRFLIAAVVLLLAWGVLCLRRLAHRCVFYPASAALAALMLLIDTSLPLSGATSPYRPVTRAQIRQIRRLPGPLIVHPGMTVYYLLLSPRADPGKQCLATIETGTPRLWREAIEQVATGCSPSMSWNEFRAKFIGDRPFTAVVSANLSPWDKAVWWCSDYDHAEAARQYKIMSLWPKHPYLVCLRYEPRKRAQWRRSAAFGWLKSGPMAAAQGESSVADLDGQPAQ